MTALGPSQPDRPFHGLWSLWEMIDLKLKPFLDAQDVIANWSSLLHARPDLFTDGIANKGRDGLIANLRPVKEQLSDREFAMCRRAIERLIEVLQVENDPKQIVSLIDDARRRMLDQGEAMSCFWLSPKERDWYEPRDPLFGAAFETKFCHGAFELEEAAKCLALERATAAVFHLMRLMEIGIRAVARCLGIPDPIKPAERNWGKILEAIKIELDVHRGRAPKVWTTIGDGDFFDSAYVSLDAVRVAWRNPTMHVENKYTQKEAENVFGAVRGFMMKLASRCDENGDPLA